jgi:hypothetical protein
VPGNDRQRSDGFDPFFTEIQDVYEELTGPSGLRWPPPRPEEKPDSADEIAATGCFGDVTARRYLWQRDYTAPQYIALLGTFSNHLTMNPAAQEALYAEVRSRLLEGAATDRARLAPGEQPATDHCNERHTDEDE